MNVVMPFLGKVVGGCSSINGMIYQRGQRQDYDGWADAAQDSSWQWDNVKNYFNKSVNYSPELPRTNEAAEFGTVI
mgnify:CR=1 FL=1